MALKLGTTDVAAIRIGTSVVSKVMVGTALVWQAYIAPVVAMPDVSDYKEATTGTVSAGVSLASNGSFSAIGGQGIGPNTGTWCTAGLPADVEVYATVAGGAGSAWSASALNTWVAAAGFYVSLDRTTNGSSSGTVNLTFRDKNTLVQLDTAAIDVSNYRGTIV